jgi:hypothetical protein
MLLSVMASPLSLYNNLLSLKNETDEGWLRVNTIYKDLNRFGLIDKMFEVLSDLEVDHLLKAAILFWIPENYRPAEVDMICIQLLQEPLTEYGIQLVIERLKNHLTENQLWQLLKQDAVKTDTKKYGYAMMSVEFLQTIRNTDYVIISEVLYG